MTFNILAHINEVRFIINMNDKNYIISITKNTVEEIDDPASIYRQGYWIAWTSNNKDVELKIENLLKKVK